METLRDVLAAARDRDGTALAAAGRPAPYGYREFGTNGWKAGNLLRHYGVRPGAGTAVVVGPKGAGPADRRVGVPDAPAPLSALLGGAALGATVDLTPASPVEDRALVVPAGWRGRYDPAPGCAVLAYGGPPEEPGVAHFERESWSENPIEVPGSVGPDDPAVSIDGEVYTHGELLDAAEAVSREHGLAEGSRVSLRAPVTEPGGLVAGVLAPLAAGATIRLPGTDREKPEEGDLAVTDGADGEAGHVAAPAVTESLRDTRRA